MNEDNRLARFFAALGKEPEGPARDLPERWRYPVYIGMLIVGVIGLALAWWLVIGPAMRTQGSRPAGPAPTTNSSPTSGAAQ